jgi:DNA-binding transcriptional LysR family regulator
MRKTSFWLRLPESRMIINTWRGGCLQKGKSLASIWASMTRSRARSCLSLIFGEALITVHSSAFPSIRPFALTPLYAALPQTHAAAQNEHVALRDLAQDDWIMFARRVHPAVHEAIMETARREGIVPKYAHDMTTTQQAVHLVAEHVGVAFLTEPMAIGFSTEGVLIKPLSDTSLCFEACAIRRTDDDSRLANEFARCFLRRYELQSLPPKRMKLSLSA